MIIKSMKKVLSRIVLAMFLLVHTIPAGICDAVIPQSVSQANPKIDASATLQQPEALQKPILRKEAQPSSLKLEGSIILSKKNPKISLSLRNSDVKQVLRMFADKAGLNIIFHSSVDGENSSNTTTTSTNNITLDLVNVPLNDAFRMVMQVAGLTYYIDKNTIVIATAAAAQSLNLSKQELMIIPVKYTNAGTLATFLNTNIFALNSAGLSNSQIAITNPATNDILIFGTQNDYIMAKKVVAQFDTKPLEQTFIVNHTTPREMANLICSVLLRDQGTSSNSSSSSSSSSGSSSSSSSSSTSLTLGGGVTACQFANSVTAGSLTSLNTPSLSIVYFSQTGTIQVVGGSTEQMAMIKDFIVKNDKKQPQAYLEVSIIELSESGSKEFNNTWTMQTPFFSGSFTGTTASNNQFPMFLSGDTYQVYDTAAKKYDPLYSLTRYAGERNILYTMSYLLQNGKGRVLANPKIIITNGQESKIDLSADYVKTVTSQIITGSLTNQTQRTYEIGNDEGIVVTITPFISPDGYVTLNIQPEYSTIKEKVYAPSSDGVSTDLAATLLQRRNLELKNIRIKDNETLVIGGMLREDEQKTISKIPVLGDLPGVGMFFRNTNSTKTKQELVIMITPKIIKDTEDVVSKQDVTL